MPHEFHEFTFWPNGNEYQQFMPRGGEPRPNRTYGGDKYFGGYSDHLPVVCVVEF